MNGFASVSQSAPPEVSLEQAALEHRGRAGAWRVDFRVVNRGDEQLELDAARLPHGQFKSAEIRFDGPLLLNAYADAIFSADVLCKEPPGLVTEKAFVILYGRYGSRGWRIFIRIRVVTNESGVPSSTVESITTQQVGFSGVTS